MTVEERIVALLAPIANEHGLDVLRVRVGRVVQVIVDRAGGVDADVLAAVSRAIALQLDVEDLMASEYRLEVASPGLDWPLTTMQDFERYKGSQLSVRFADFGELEGENCGATSTHFHLRDAHGEMHDIALDEPIKVVRSIQWKKLSPSVDKKKKKKS